jgi:hypothetical protein
MCMITGLMPDHHFSPSLESSAGGTLAIMRFFRAGITAGFPAQLGAGAVLFSTEFTPSFGFSSSAHCASSSATCGGRAG